jgi:hypothetical protein
MKNNYLYSSLLVVAASLLFSGCLIFHHITYDVKLDTPTSGIAEIIAYDMRSDAKNKSELEKDKNNLFQHMLKSNEFIKEQKESGKYVTGRKLYVEDGKLIGQGTYKFDDISAVEGIKYEGGFHYLNLGLDDSVLSTNGEIIHSKEYKRIVWDSTFQELKFTMFSNELNGSQYKPLAPYFENKKK